MLELKTKLDIHSKNYLNVLEIIKSSNKNARLVGGVVRDAILGARSRDIDIATNMLPDEVIKLFTSLNHKVIPTGIKFGTVTLLYKGEVFEITTLRSDIICDGRHAKVEYGNDFYLDAIRRDFTINALSYCPFEEKIFDYFDGVEDLKNGIVKFIGNSDQRIKEDYLRILRFFRFFGRFGKEIDTNSFESCIKYKASLKNLSKERIKSELDLILKLPNFTDIILLMKKILPEILPIADSGIDNILVAKNIAQKFGVALGVEVKYALLLLGTDNNLLITKLGFSRLETKNICAFLSVLNNNIDEYFLKKLWIDHDNFEEFFVFLTVINPETEKMSELFSTLRNSKKPVFFINGHDIMSLGIVGPAVKSELAKLEKKWIESNFQLTKEELIRH